MKKFLFFLITVLMFFNSGCAINEKENNEEIITPNEYTIPIENKVFLGNEGAMNEIVYFGDYECTSCNYFYEKTFSEINKKFIETGKAKFYHFDISFVDETSYAKAMLGNYIELTYPEIYHSYVRKMHLIDDKESENLLQKRLMIKKMKELFPDYSWNEGIGMVFEDDENLRTKLEKNINVLKEKEKKYVPVLFINGIEVRDVHSISEITAHLIKTEQ